LAAEHQQKSQQPAYKRSSQSIRRGNLKAKNSRSVNTLNLEPTTPPCIRSLHEDRTTHATTTTPNAPQLAPGHHARSPFGDTLKGSRRHLGDDTTGPPDTAKREAPWGYATFEKGTTLETTRRRHPKRLQATRQRRPSDEDEAKRSHHDDQHSTMTGEGVRRSETTKYADDEAKQAEAAPRSVESDC
jgi:hypothetical protein